MSFAYMPLFTGDYLRDTRHLTPQKHGVYLLLLMHCWDQKGPLPLDEQECAGIANCRSADEVESLRYVLKRYFVRMDDGFYNLRAQKEISKSEYISVKRSGAGKVGAQARRKQREIKQVLSKCLANDEHLPVTPIPIPIPTTTTSKSKSLAQQAERFEDFWKAYPRKVGKATALRKWKSKKLDSRADEIISHVKERVKSDPQWQDQQYIPHPSTFINRDGWDDEVAEQQSTPRSWS